ncbi:hypothetical protein SLA2020_486780 [Shorea laevis]
MEEFCGNSQNPNPRIKLRARRGMILGSIDRRYPELEKQRIQSKRKREEIRGMLERTKRGSEIERSGLGKVGARSYRNVTGDPSRGREM